MKIKTISSLIACLVFPAAPVVVTAAENTAVDTDTARVPQKIALRTASPSDGTPVELDTIVVLGKQEVVRTDKSLAGSVDVITRDELEYEHVTDTLELFTKTPGVVLSRFSQGIVNTEVSIRGFSGDGETPNAKLLVDGIPSNLFSGLSELDYLFPTNIQSIQVYKGTSDASTGLFATAGNYKIETRKDTGKQLQAGYGSFNTKEMQGYYGDKQGDFTQNYAIGYRQGNGYRDHTENEKIALSGRWQQDFAQSSLALSAKYGKYNSPEAPGYMTKSQARSNPTGVAANALNDRGEKEFKHLSLHYDYFFNDDADLHLKSYWQQFDRERSVRFIGSPAVENRFEEQTSVGFIANMQWRVHPHWSVESGYDIEQQRVDEFRQRLTSIRRRADYDFTAQGVYAKLEHTPVDWLRWNVAYRVDRLHANANGPFVVNNTTLTTTMLEAQRIQQPKFNVFANLTEQQMLFFNAGRSFQTPTGIDLNTRGNTVPVDIAINDGWELGLKSSWQPGLNSRLSYWQQKAEDEFINIDGTRRLFGATRRQGVDASVDYVLNDQWSFWGNVSRVWAKIDEPNAQNPAFQGNTIRGIPEYTASIGMQVIPHPLLVARVHIDSQGNYFVNESNRGGKYGGYTLTNANVDYKTSWGRVSLLANNLFDRYYEYVYDFSTTGNETSLNFAPGAGRNFMLTATVDFK